MSSMHPHNESYRVECERNLAEYRQRTQQLDESNWEPWKVVQLEVNQLAHERAAWSMQLDELGFQLMSDGTIVRSAPVGASHV